MIFVVFHLNKKCNIWQHGVWHHLHNPMVPCFDAELRLLSVWCFSIPTMFTWGSLNCLYYIALGCE